MARKSSAVLAVTADASAPVVSLKDQMKSAKDALKAEQAAAKHTAKNIMALTKNIAKIEAQMLKAKPAPKPAKA